MIIASVPDDGSFAARVTTFQFMALKARLSREVVVAQTGTLPHRLTCKKASNYNSNEVQRWLVNGWNTEYLLYLNSTALDGDGLHHALHWAFPQAYYAVFAVTLAYYRAVGYTETSHKAVIKKLGRCVTAGHYPNAIAFAMDGGKPRTQLHLSECALPTPLHFDRGDAAVVDTWIRRFLNATREADLKACLKAAKLKTKDLKPKKAFSKEDWANASNALGPTTLLSLLYRKRIKANYSDIDTFLHHDLDASSVFGSLSACVAAMNFVHETFIYRAIGATDFEALVNRLQPKAQTRVRRRLAAIVTYST